MIKKLAIVSLSATLVACGGPSSSEIETAFNAQIEVAKEFQKLAGGSDSCPTTYDGLESVNVMLRQTCILWYSKIEDVDIQSCIEKPNGNYSCKFDYALKSERYGEFPDTAESTFEETASGWKEVN